MDATRIGSGENSRVVFEDLEAAPEADKGAATDGE